jgi:hypothetical protein
MITKKLKNEIFAWNPDAFDGKGYWYVLGTKGGLGRAASKKEATFLGKPAIDTVNPVSVKVYDENNPNVKVKKQGEDQEEEDLDEGLHRFEKAKQTRKTKLGDLIADKILAGQTGGKAIKGAVTDKFKATVSGIKEKFDPLNIAKKLTGSGGAALLGSAMGRSKEDIEYFSGRKGQGQEAKKKGKKGTAEPMVTTISGAKLKPVQSQDSVANVAAKLYGLFKTHFDEVKLKGELAKNKEEEQESERERRHKELINAIKGRGKGTEKPTASKDDGGGLAGLLAGAAALWEMFHDQILGMLRPMMEKSSELLAQIVSKISGFFKKTLEKVKGWITTAVNFVKRVASKIYETVKGWVTKAIEHVTSMISKLGSMIIEAISAIPYVGPKLAAGLQKGFEKVTSGIKAVAEKISGAKSLFGKGASEAAEKGAGKVAEKAAMKGGMKAGLKAIPVLGLAAGAWFAAEQAMKGNWTGAGLEIASAAAGTLPGVGTAAGLGLGAAAVAQEAYYDMQNDKGGDEKKKSATAVDKPASPAPGPAPKASGGEKSGGTAKQVASAAPATPPPKTGERLDAASKENSVAQATSSGGSAPVVMNNTNNSSTPGQSTSQSVGLSTVRDDDSSINRTTRNSLRMV